MPPNSHQQQDDITILTSFTNSFWSKDKSGVNQLLNYIKSTHDDLDIIYAIYTQRSKLEQEFGEKLLSLSSIQEIDEAEKKQGIPAAYQAISLELKKTGNSHLELSQKLTSKVASEFEQKLDEYKLLLENWTKTLDELYNERQEKTIELLKIRSKYLKEHDTSKGQATPTMDKLKSQYKSLVSEVDELSQEWNTTWKDACEVMEAMEEDRVEFLKSNVWEYANLASARLLIEDEWCETIRKQLEKCSAEQEIEKCISIYGIGSKIPTTNEYVGEQMREQKRKIAAEQHSSSPVVPPKPPAKPPRQQQEQQDQYSKSQSKKEEDQAHCDNRSNNRQQKTPRQKQETDDNKKNDSHQHRGIIRHQQRHEQYAEEEEEEKHVQKSAQSTRQEEKYTSHVKNDDRRREISNKSLSQRPPRAEEQQQHISGSSRLDKRRMSQICSKMSDNIGSTASRGHIKRKPLNKSLMDQVSNQMALARQQRELSEVEEEPIRCDSHVSLVKDNESIPTDAQKRHKKIGSDGSLDSLLKTFEVVDSVTGVNTPSPPPIAAVSEEARSRRQPSEYKPDTGSIPTRRGNTANNNKNSRVLQEVITDEILPTPLSSTSSTTNSSTNTSTSNMQDPYTHPIAAPKSPRPPAQQISAEAQQQTDYHQNYQQPVDMHGHYPQHQTYHLSPSMMTHQTIADQNAAIYHDHQQQQKYMGEQQPQYMGQQYMNQSPRSPIIQQPLHSPMMQPQRSPMMQPQKSPMMQPMHSPIMQQQQQQNHFVTQRGSLPPPITIPVTNYGVTPQPSPNMAYANVSGISPGGVLPAPVYNQQPRPTQYSDGRGILFWVRAKYDYTASDQGELSFKAHTLIGVLEADMTQQSWWHGAIWDEYRYSWSSVAGSIPSNFMANAYN